MSKLSLLKIAVALCFISILMSCQKDAISEKEAGGIARLEVSVPVAETKLVSGCNETAIKNYQVFLSMIRMFWRPMSIAVLRTYLSTVHWARRLWWYWQMLRL